MTIYICKCCRRPASVSHHPATDTSPAYADIICLTPGCPLLNVETDSRDEMGIANRFIQPVAPPVLKPTINPDKGNMSLTFKRVKATAQDTASVMERFCHRHPSFIALKIGDPVPPELRAALNVTGFMRELGKIALQKMADDEEPLTD